MDGNTWIARFAERLGIAVPDPAVVEELLALAGDAAHASERLAAPIACYLVGLAGIDPIAARGVASSIEQSQGDDQ